MKYDFLEIFLTPAVTLCGTPPHTSSGVRMPPNPRFFCLQLLRTCIQKYSKIIKIVHK